MALKKNKDGYFRSTFVIGKKPDGKPERITIRAKTKKEHDEKLAEAKRLHSKGISQNSLTVGEWADRWLRVYKANASRGQQAMYAAKLKNNIVPVIGNFEIKNIRASHLQDLLNSHTDGKYSTVQKIRLTIQQMFADAEMEGVIERNPASRLELPNLTETERRPLTDIERATVYNVAQTHKCGAYVLVMLFCGLRRGECIALRTRDVDLEKKKIIVTKAVSLWEKNIGYEKGPKSEAGIRMIPIPEILMPCLIAHCSGRKPDDIIFSKTDGNFATKTTVRWWWQSFVRECHIVAGAKLYRNAIQYETSPFGKEVTPHFLRHTYATDLYAAGVDENAQRTFLGHTSTDVTDVYRKMSDVAFERARKCINEFYSEMDLSLTRNEK